MLSRILVLLVVAVLASACASNESAGPPNLVDVIASELGGEALTSEENTCLAESIVETVGADELAEMGITEDGIAPDIELSAENDQLLSESFDAGMATCVDLREVLSRAAAESSDDGICVLDQLSDDQLFTMYGLFTGRSDLTQEQVDDLNATATRAEEICNPGVLSNP